MGKEDRYFLENACVSLCAGYNYYDLGGLYQRVAALVVESLDCILPGKIETQSAELKPVESRRNCDFTWHNVATCELYFGRRMEVGSEMHNRRGCWERDYLLRESESH